MNAIDSPRPIHTAPIVAAPRAPAPAPPRPVQRIPAGSHAGGTPGLAGARAQVSTGPAPSTTVIVSGRDGVRHPIVYEADAARRHVRLPDTEQSVAFLLAVHG